MTDRHSAFTAMLIRHRDMLWRMCVKRVGDDSERCKDLLQEISIALWVNFDKLRPGSSPRQERAWVRWQARSVFYQIERHRSLPTVPLTDSLADSIADSTAQHSDSLTESMLPSLSPDEQRMVRLYLDGYRGDEIGELLGVSRDAVYQRMRRLVRKLRNVALVLLAFLLTATASVALVPQWRRLIFGGGDAHETLTDTISVLDMPAPPADSLLSASPVTRASLRKQLPIDRMPPLDLVGLTDFPKQLQPVPVPDRISVSVEGTNLIVAGAEGEMIQVYDNSGRLVARQVAGEISIIYLFPVFDFAPWLWSREYNLLIGSRPPMTIRF